MTKFTRVVNTIEKCFGEYAEKHVEVLSFHQIRDWYNDNTKDGITSARLINLLRKRRQFIWQHTERKVGSNTTLSYWSLGATAVLPNPGKGWVLVTMKE
tara:strand:- start:176 stop:472 length:297 start_codon:yes stop_codon:yes gene_type:complete